MAFISSAKHSSGNEEVNTTSVSTASTNVSTASANIRAASISQDNACAYIASQSNGSQIKFEDINQIDEDDIEEMDIKWNMALLSMRADRFWKKTGKKITIQGIDVTGFDKLKVECFNCYKMGHFARECRAPKSQDKGRRDNYRQGSKVKEQTLKDLMATDRVGWDYSYMNMIYHYKLGLSQVEARLVEHRNQEVKYCEKIRVLEFKAESRANCIESLTKELELIKIEKEGLDSKLAGFQTASKDLDSLLESQRLDKNKEGPSPAIESTSGDAQNKNPSVTETEASPSTISPKPFIKFVKSTDRSTETKTSKVKTAKPSVKYAAMYSKPSKSSNIRGNQRNWNNLKSQQLGKNFVMKNKACFNYGQFDHLSYNYGLGVKMGRSSLKNNYTHRSMPPKPAIHKPYRPPLRPIRPNMNAAYPNRTTFNKPAHSYAKRPFQRTSTVRPQFRGPRVPIVTKKFPTVNRKFPTGNIKFPTADQGNKGKAVKASACWIWKPTHNISNKGPNRNSVSVMFKKYTYIDTQDRLNNAQDTCKANTPERSGNPNPTASTTNPLADQMETLTVETPIPTVSSPVLTACFTDSQEPSSNTRLISKRVTNQEETPSLDNILTLTNWFEDILRVTTNSVDLDGMEADGYNRSDLFIRKKRRDFILVQVYVDDIIFGSSNPQLCSEFETLMHEKFQMSVMGELNFFLGLKFRYSDVRSANTPIDKENPWGKDGTGKDVDLHLYRSMIGSLMYLTASRPDIMFAVCTCARHQVTPKECHLHAVNRIFRYLKGHPKLGLWYPKEYPFNLVAYSDGNARSRQLWPT
nr:hypothetical protein [Tanacetum cinerariifolium]